LQGLGASSWKSQHQANTHAPDLEEDAGGVVADLAVTPHPTPYTFRSETLHMHAPDLEEDAGGVVADLVQGGKPV
jgi:hypothetical protein